MLEVLVDVAIPYNCKEFIFHKICSFDSILKSGLVAGRRASRDEIQTVFFTLLNPLLEDDRRRMAKPQLEETESGTLIDSSGDLCLLGQFSQRDRQW